MKHVIYQNREHVLLREWKDSIELADVQTGKAIHVRDERERQEVKAGMYDVDHPLTNSFRAYESRSKEDLISLRQRRTTILLGKPPKQKRASKASTKSQAPSGSLDNGQRKRRGRAKSRASSFSIPEAVLMHLPEAERKKIMESVRKLGEQSK